MSLQDGYAALLRKDYPGAEAAAREVLQGSRTSPRAYDAQYLLAQSLAGQRNYAQAAIAYDDTYNRARTGGHAPEALLGLADSLTAIGEKRAACDTLTKLAAEFPRQSGELRDRAKGVGQRAGCR
jgi:TolA-binding protein